MKKYHLSEDGIVRKCSATKEPCRLKHFESFNEGNSFYENQMKSEVLSNRLKKDSKTKDKDSYSVPDEDGDTHSAKVARDYRHYSLIHNRIHSSTLMPTESELSYYSTPTGRLELERRSRNNGVE